ncbi:outer envelope pore protein 37, chloroplastic-like [Phragmites australis]|uniref:outer envelope pore protein 37, chloroplastic-like n=1 Tax=Phragmites australis TaxID=29695 RepID=UPI002D792038|nr:outer envelope pore protein 37, chloroplastic-like [Phragmites australis]
MSMFPVGIWEFYLRVTDMLVFDLSFTIDMEDIRMKLDGALQTEDISFNLTSERATRISASSNFRDSPGKIELSSPVPPDGLPRATFFFPNGEVSVKENELDEADRILSVKWYSEVTYSEVGCTALYSDNAMNIKYRYKDEEILFIPSISLPSNSLPFAFKRQLTPSDKLSYWYNFGTNYWGTVFKHKANKHLKWKAGYESDNRLGWVCLWVGDGSCSTKEVPLKAKVRFTLKVPQGNLQNSVVLFHVKKRGDF